MAKFLNQALITIGTLAVLGLCFFFWFSIQSSHFESQARAFANGYVFKLSESWEFSEVEAESSPDFMSMVSTDNGRETVKIFRRFGKLIEISDFQALHTTISFGETSGIYQFKASFVNTKAVGLIEIIEIEGQLRVRGLRFNVTEPLPTKISEFKA